MSYSRLFSNHSMVFIINVSFRLKRKHRRPKNADEFESCVYEINREAPSAFEGIAKSNLFWPVLTRIWYRHIFYIKNFSLNVAHTEFRISVWHFCFLPISVSDSSIYVPGFCVEEIVCYENVIIRFHNAIMWLGHGPLHW